MNMDVIYGLVGLASIIVIIVVAILLIGKARSRPVKLVLKEDGKEGKVVEVPPQFSASKVLVLEMLGSTIRVHKCSVVNDTLVDDKEKKTWIAPPNVKPFLMVSRGLLRLKAVPAFFVDHLGRFIEFKDSNDGKKEKEIKALDPDFAYSLLNSKVLKKISHHIASDPQTFLMGLGIGAMLIALVIFVVLPLLGIPVAIGRQPVEVSITYPTAPPPQHPPAGNYTPAVGG